MADSLRKNTLKSEALPDLVRDLKIDHEVGSESGSESDSESEFEPEPEMKDSMEPLTKLPFPPLTKRHILNCSYHSWHPRYRAITPKARLIPLTQPFLEYLRADGIVLPEDESAQGTISDSDSGIFSSTDDPEASDDEAQDPAEQWRDVHDNIRSTITELDGKVVPKLNWSAPKDATWMSATNSMECRSPNDIYLLLKSSDFVTHDLEHAFDDCEDDGNTTAIPYHLVLRKYVQLNPALEFRCFVRDRNIIAICQRDLNHFEFLFSMRDKLRREIQDLFDDKLKDTFHDKDFVFDVYIPPPHKRVWLIDINPWAQRTDPLLFSWLELLTMPGPTTSVLPNNIEGRLEEYGLPEEVFVPEFRLVQKDDPEAYGFTTPQYSAHKLPRDVVDASRGGEGQLKEFAEKWKEMMEKQQQEESEDSEAD